MANPHRGEISAILDGQIFTLCLTLGALAELEEQLGGQDILALAQRFETGRITAGEAISVIGAGLRGAGNDIPNERVARMRVAGGVAGYLELVINLLQAAFGGEPQPAGEPGGESGGPFHGGA